MHCTATFMKEGVMMYSVIPHIYIIPLLSISGYVLLCKEVSFLINTLHTIIIIE